MATINDFGVSSYVFYFSLSSNKFYKTPRRNTDDPSWLLFGDTYGVTWDWRDNGDKIPANAINHPRGTYWTNSGGALKFWLCSFHGQVNNFPLSVNLFTDRFLFLSLLKNEKRY